MERAAALMTSPRLMFLCRCRQQESKQPACPAPMPKSQPAFWARGAGCASDKRCGLRVGLRGALRRGITARGMAATVVACVHALGGGALARAQVSVTPEPALRAPAQK